MAGPAARPAAWPKEPPGGGRLLLPLPREAWPKAPRGLAMPGKGSGPRVRGRRGAERGGVCGPGGGAPAGTGGAPSSRRPPPGGRGRAGAAAPERAGGARRV